nr:hypothetical protein [Paenibacillus sp. MMS18-CY102]
MATAFTAAASPVHASSNKENAKIILTVRYGHDELASMMSIDSPSLGRALSQAKRVPAPEAQTNKMDDVEVIVMMSHKPTVLRLEPSGQLWDAAAQQRLSPTAETASKLLSLASQLRANHYGAMISWTEAKQLVPLKRIFTITDMGTGLSFRVQRRAGSDHADVQPIAKEDSRIMKQIYNGHWSWNRRAVLVHSGQHWLAASMNGMPHGGDGIPDNDFSGHFCLHFLGSTTHKSEIPDLAHQLMVHKAGGQLRSMLDAAPPLQLAESFVEALNHHDQDVLQELMVGLTENEQAPKLAEMNAIQSIRVNKNKSRKPQPSTAQGIESEQNTQALTAQIQLSVTLLKRNESEHRTTYAFTFQRNSPSASWRLKQVTM